MSKSTEILNYFVQQLSVAIYARHEVMPSKRLPWSGRKNAISTMLVVPLKGENDYDLAVQTIHRALNGIGSPKLTSWGGPGRMDHEWKWPQGKVFVVAKPFGVGILHLIIHIKH